jgi:hypothetical protein
VITAPLAQRTPPSWEYARHWGHVIEVIDYRAKPFHVDVALRVVTRFGTGDIDGNVHTHRGSFGVVYPEAVARLHRRVSAHGVLADPQPSPGRPVSDDRG